MDEGINKKTSSRILRSNNDYWSTLAKNDWSNKLVHGRWNGLSYDWPLEGWDWWLDPWDHIIYYKPTIVRNINGFVQQCL